MAFVEVSSAINGVLRKRVESLYFTRNLQYSIPVTLLAFYLMVGGIQEFGHTVAVTLLLTVGVAAFNMMPIVDDVLHGRGTPQNIPWFFLGFMALLIIAGTEGSSGGPGEMLFQFSMVGILLVSLVMPPRLRAPTKVGRETMTQVEGYRWFLNAVEVDKLHRMKSDDWTPSAATEHLAYAVALDLKDGWQDYLANCDFRSVVWDASQNKPASPAAQAALAASGATGWGFLQRMALRFCIVFGVMFAFGWLKPSDFIVPFWPTMIVLGLAAIFVFTWPTMRRRFSSPLGMPALLCLRRWDGDICCAWRGICVSVWWVCMRCA